MSHQQTPDLRRLARRLAKQGYVCHEPQNLGPLPPSAEDDLHRVWAYSPTMPIDPYSPGRRRRTHALYVWRSRDEEPRFAPNAPYSQTRTNPQDGDKVREFQDIDESLVESGLLRHLRDWSLRLFLATAEEDPDAVSDKHGRLDPTEPMEIRHHLIRYEPTSQEAAFSSPLEAHTDDEPFVVLFLLERTSGLLGGDNFIISGTKNQPHVLGFFRQDVVFQGFTVTRRDRHMVTPMYLPQGVCAGHRTILLVTVDRPKKPSPKQEPPQTVVA